MIWSILLEQGASCSVLDLRTVNNWYSGILANGRGKKGLWVDARSEEWNFQGIQKKPFSLRVIPLMIRNNSTFVKWLEAYWLWIEKLLYMRLGITDLGWFLLYL